MVHDVPLQSVQAAQLQVRTLLMNLEGGEVSAAKSEAIEMTRLFLALMRRAKIDALGVAMPGPQLSQRLGKIIRAAPMARISGIRAVCVIAYCTIVCTAFVVVSLARAQSSATTDWEKGAGGKMSFDVGSVKRNDQPMSFSNHPTSNVRMDDGDAFIRNGGLFSGVDLMLSEYIGFAYKLSAAQSGSLNSQLPGWASTERFDIQGRTQSNAGKDQMRLMMQSLLADRFKLAVHFDTHEVPVYALVVATPGKLKPHPDDSPCDPVEDPSRGGGGLGVGLGCESFMVHVPGDGYMYMLGGDVSMAQITSMLQSQGRPVIDQTGLKGRFDVTIKWSAPTPGGPLAPPQAGMDVDTQAAFVAAVREQLGLKLVSARGPVEALVIEHIEEPTPN